MSQYKISFTVITSELFTLDALRVVAAGLVRHPNLDPKISDADCADPLQVCFIFDHHATMPYSHTVDQKANGITLFTVRLTNQFPGMPDQSVNVFVHKMLLEHLRSVETKRRVVDTSTLPVICSFRAEYPGDVQEVMKAIWTLQDQCDVRQTHVRAEYTYQFPTLEPVVEIRSATITFADVVKLLQGIEDSHIMLDTIRPLPLEQNSLERNNE